MMDEEEDETSSYRSHSFDLPMKRSNSTPALPLLINATEYVTSFFTSVRIISFCFSFLETICSLMMLIFVIRNYVDIVRHL